MAGYRATETRKPANETEFEKNCVVLFRELLNDPNTKRVGTKGQRQKGLDVIGNRNRDPKKLVGVQCKLKSGKSKLTKTEAAKEIKEALTYKPQIRYFIVATSKDDIALQQYAQAETQRTKCGGTRDSNTSPRRPRRHSTLVLAPASPRKTRSSTRCCPGKNRPVRRK